MSGIKYGSMVIDDLRLWYKYDFPMITTYESLSYCNIKKKKFPFMKRNILVHIRRKSLDKFKLLDKLNQLYSNTYNISYKDIKKSEIEFLFVKKDFIQNFKMRFRINED